MHHPDSRKHIPALPFCHFKLSKKIQPLNYPNKIETLGDHIRARRLDLKLFQRNVAKIIGASAESINHWETKTRKPEVKFYPKIMEFLGYCPVHYFKSFGQLLFLHRTHRGLSHRGLGKRLQIDPATLSRWESDIRLPRKMHQQDIDNFFHSGH
jgi:DNA-binding transcriptional regulator YiaG